PTGQLVVRGLYRYVRNPMYLAVLAVIVGQVLLLGRPVLLGYAAIVGTAFVAFVHGYEQPTLARRYGAQYEAYRRAVPGWYPRRRASQTSSAGQRRTHSSGNSGKSLLTPSGGTWTSIRSSTVRPQPVMSRIHSPCGSVN